AAGVFLDARYRASRDRVLYRQTVSRMAGQSVRFGARRAGVGPARLERRPGRRRAAPVDRAERADPGREPGSRRRVVRHDGRTGGKDPPPRAETMSIPSERLPFRATLAEYEQQAEGLRAGWTAGD